jgi:lipid-binding SYLF domain-containing protein
MKVSSSKSFVSIGILAFIAFIGTGALAADTATIDKQVAGTLTRFDALSPKHPGLISHAVGVLVFPRITKAGVGVGGEHGDGSLSVGGKTVAYYSVSGASIGLTLGVARHSEVILFNSQQALDKFTNGGDWSIGADTSVVIMKDGAGGDYDVETLHKPVLVFVFGEKGLMGDASLKGAKISKINP